MPSNYSCAHNFMLVSFLRSKARFRNLSYFSICWQVQVSSTIRNSLQKVSMDYQSSWRHWPMYERSLICLRISLLSFSVACPLAAWVSASLRKSCALFFDSSVISTPLRVSKNVPSARTMKSLTMIGTESVYEFAFDSLTIKSSISFAFSEPIS